ncbi:hypothetical protein NRF20_00860 [Streptomyces sp. R-74717]|uniref:hypothetical protein n=1 Tax=Streptomyces TaxID=1883 RepID=UPI0037AE1560
MASYAKDPRCIAMADALVPLLRRSCPEGAGGYGGSYQVNLDDEEAVGLGGVELIRAADSVAQFVWARGPLMCEGDLPDS